MEDNPIEAETLPSPIPNGSFVIDANTGAPVTANRSRLAASLRNSDGHDVQYVWVTSGAKGVRCFANITGERIGKADWSAKVGAVESVQIVEKNGKSFVLLTHMEV